MSGAYKKFLEWILIVKYKDIIYILYYISAENLLVA